MNIKAARARRALVIITFSVVTAGSAEAVSHTSASAAAVPVHAIAAPAMTFGGTASFGIRWS